jgi:hypothetical protein
MIAPPTAFSQVLVGGADDHEKQQKRNRCRTQCVEIAKKVTVATGR